MERKIRPKNLLRNINPRYIKQDSKHRFVTDEEKEQWSSSGMAEHGNELHNPNFFPAKVITGSDPLGSYTDSGYYAVQTNNPPDKPTPRFSMMYVENVQDQYITQRIWCRDIPEQFYVRYTANGGDSWSSWKEWNIDGYVKRSGDTMTGSLHLTNGNIIIPSNNRIHLDGDNSPTTYLSAEEWNDGFRFRTNGGVVFYTGGFSERARINDAGRVGIGTTNPLEMLDVNGKIKCNSLRRAHIHKYSTSVNSSQSSDIKMGELTFNGDYHNVTIHGTVYIQSGGNVGITNFHVVLRSNALPSKTIKYWQEKNNYGLEADIIVRENTNSGRVVIGFSPSGSMHNFNWDLAVVERTGYNYWENVTGYVQMPTSGLSTISIESNPRLRNIPWRMQLEHSGLSINDWSIRNIRANTSGPSGGANGDVWMEY